MSPRYRRTRTVVTIVMAALLIGGAPTAQVRALSAPDQSDVVLVLDFSASILRDAANRNRFSTALERIADRVDETSADLVAGDTTVTFLQFAAKAADYRGCTDLKLLGDPTAVAQFATCLRSVAAAYRKGLEFRAHPTDRHRHELRRGDAAGRQAPSAGCGPADHDLVHRRQA